MVKSKAALSINNTYTVGVISSVTVSFKIGFFLLAILGKGKLKTKTVIKTHSKAQKEKMPHIFAVGI